MRASRSSAGVPRWRHASLAAAASRSSISEERRRSSAASLRRLRRGEGGWCDACGTTGQGEYTRGGESGLARSSKTSSTSDLLVGRTLACSSARLCDCMAALRRLSADAARCSIPSRRSRPATTLVSSCVWDAQWDRPKRVLLQCVEGDLAWDASPRLHARWPRRSSRDILRVEETGAWLAAALKQAAQEGGVCLWLERLGPEVGDLKQYVLQRGPGGAQLWPSRSLEAGGPLAQP